MLSWGEQDVRGVALRDGQSLVIGRAEPAQVILEERSLSRTHARVSLREGRLFVEDLNSTNGVTLNGVAVRESFLGAGDVMRLGSVDLRITGVLERAVAPGWASQVSWSQRVEDELLRARVFGRGFSVVAVRSAQDRQPKLVLRDVDLAYRYAPGLSLVLLPEFRAADLTTWAAQLRRRDAGSMAIGAALAPEHGVSTEALLACAVEASRRAKSGVGVEVAEVRRMRTELAAPIVESPPMIRLYEIVARVARTNLPVLVLGETGSGKEHVAQAVHQKSACAEGPFKALNCATIPANLIESVLFGHERGAFTGADKQSPGIFEQAQGGTVFLDEIGELSERAQAALLRVFETRRIVRVGGTREIDVDVRMVAATHRDLSAMVARGSFREDLMFRLDALSLRVPPLRERREEIGPLARLFLERARTTWGSQVTRIAEDAQEALDGYAWPGNVRQLKNVIERAVAVCGGTTIEVEDLPEQILAQGLPQVSDVQVPAMGSSVGSLPERVRAFEGGLIREALEKSCGNQAQAARILGVPRRTLAHKVQALGLLG